MTSEEVQNRVTQVLRKLADEREFDADGLTLQTGLIDDMGMDSMRFVDLTLALEETLGLHEFPMQKWVDEEAQTTGPRFTVKSLIGACERALVNAGSAAIAV